MAAQFPVDGRWVSSVVALSRLPPPGTEAFYFARGHAEQWPHLPAAPEGHAHGVPCEVTAVDYFTDGEEPCARITLLPRPHNPPPAAIDIPAPGRFVFYAKQIQQGDWQRSYFQVPKECERLVPPHQAAGDKQDLLLHDISGNSWNMEHTHRGATRSLSRDWQDLVHEKGVKVRDIIVFVRCPDGRILVDLRRATPVNRDWGGQEVAQASQLAIEGGAFTVTYYPGRGGESFVVPRAVVDAAAEREWEVDTPVRLLPKDEVVHVQQQGSASGVIARGTIGAVVPGATTWRSLQVDWDGSTSSTPAVNKWQVEPEGTRDAKRRRLSKTVPPVASTAQRGVKLFGKTLVPEGSGSRS
uniref:Auxin response factor n=1 Tax=Aegilops tauschii TaxID=37682 RepID=N1R5L1_AEGTA